MAMVVSIFGTPDTGLQTETSPGLTHELILNGFPQVLQLLAVRLLGFLRNIGVLERSFEPTDSSHHVSR